ncbi:AcrR family transcriptional regulator [Thermocatellispora tengchongensis]|uniref:AcrR family transcriptional regulator n=1 Tax=Thermocatellispora tengchongensis TaxID=1073253 RepID=A0A840PNQ7_9ACTN|nr:TetR/AcrR family transcriptional regulator [Thermocatellispora tengchongensis]MBB5139673.1 AcrR family transcriptional regulator [Thermocatellispora tengchongensis]
MGTTTGRRLRADAERSIRAITTAAERLLSGNPAATMEQIAEEAGVSRATIHRRFASREALIEAMEATAWREIDEAIEAAHPATAPPLVALHQATANILRIKSGWRFALARTVPLGAEAGRIRERVMARCEAAFRRAREEGLLRPDADPAWVRRAYLALLTETAHQEPGEAEPDLLAARMLDTLLYGVGRQD